MHLQRTPHCWGLLVLLQSLPTIHSSHTSLEQIRLEAIFEIFTHAIFEAIEVKGLRSEVIEVTKLANKNSMQIL